MKTIIVDFLNMFMNAIEVTSRNQFGTTEARAVRRENKVPGSIYGGKDTEQKPLSGGSFALDKKVLLKLMTDPSFYSRVHHLSIEGKIEMALAKKIQLHPVTDEPLHIEFMRVTKDSKIHVFVPVVFLNEDKSPGIKLGGILNIVVHSLEIICSPDVIPPKFEIDLTGLDLHKTIHLADIKLPKEAKAAHPERDNVIATLVSSSGVAEKEE